MVYNDFKIFITPHSYSKEPYQSEKSDDNQKAITQSTLLLSSSPPDSSSSGGSGFVHQLVVIPIPDNTLNRAPSRLIKK